MTAIFGRPWLIEPNELERLAVVEASQSDYSEGIGDRDIRERPYAIEGATAVIPVTGILVARQNLSSLIRGATSYREIEDALMTASMDGSVDAIRFEIDSPGGDAMGVQCLGDLIYGCRKRTTALAIGQCQSAAYWLASQCDAIVAAPSAIIGSIGTVLKVRSDAGNEGIVVFRSSPLKHADPETDEGASQYQQIVDDLTVLFVENVARGRGVTKEEVRDSYGNGASMVTARALEAGMIDGVQSAAHADGNHGRMANSDKQGVTMTDIKLTAEGFEALQAERDALASKISEMEARAEDFEPKNVSEALRVEIETLKASHFEAIEQTKAEAQDALREAEAGKAKAEEDLTVGLLLAHGIITREEEVEAHEAYTLRESHPSIWNRYANRTEPQIPLGEIGHGVTPPSPAPKVDSLSAANFTQVDAMVKAYCEENNLDFVANYGTALRAVKESIR